MDKVLTVGGVIITVLVLYFMLSLLISWPFVWLWNMTIPATFGGPALTFWAGFRLLLISAILIKGVSADTNASK